jgi:DNA repair exonuclease SbcCD ATPase subunit
VTPLSDALGRPKSWLLNGAASADDLAVLELRLRDIERAMASLAEQREELARRFASVEEQEVAQLEAADQLRAQAADLDIRERALEERAAALSARDALISKLEAELSSKTADLVRDATELEAAREAFVAAQAELAAERRALEAMRLGTQTHATLQARLAESRDVWARWTLPELRGLVSENGSTYPDRRKEWDTYLQQLEQFANFEGRLPAAFEGVLEDVFAPVLESSAQALGLAPDEGVLTPSRPEEPPPRESF